MVGCAAPVVALRADCASAGAIRDDMINDDMIKDDTITDDVIKDDTITDDVINDERTRALNRVDTSSSRIRISDLLLFPSGNMAE
jgi:hypothetical protein